MASNNVAEFKQQIDRLRGVAKATIEDVDTLVVLDEDDFKSMPLQDIARMMKELQELHEELDYSKKKIGVLFDNVRTRHLPQRMDEDDIASFKVEGLGSVRLTDDLRVKVLDQEKEFEWLEEIGCGDLISSTVNSSSLKALLRRRLVAGEEVPSDIFEVAPFTRASITKS